MYKIFISEIFSNFTVLSKYAEEVSSLQSEVKKNVNPHRSLAPSKQICISDKYSKLHHNISWLYLRTQCL